MKLTTLATLSALVVAHVAAEPDVDMPSGVPATSGLPFGTLSFDTTAPPSLLSALSSLISSESTAVMPFTTTHSNSVPTSSGSAGTATGTSTPTTVSPSVSVVPTTAIPTNTSGARRLREGGSGVVAGVVLGAVAALIC